MAGVALKNINKIYPGGTQAVFNLDLEVKDGEFLVLFGAENSGKTSILRMIAGLEDVSVGELFIGNDLVNDVPPKDRDIAMVFQNAMVYQHLSVYDNMGFGLRLRKLPEPVIEVRVKEAAALLGLTDILQKKAKQLSAMQRQRVSLGATVVREPKVVLLDEPLSNLDPKLRTQMRGDLTKVQARLKGTFIYATHDAVEAMALGDRIVVLKDGFVQQVDTPQNLYDYPVNLYVADTMGSELKFVRGAEICEEEGNFFLKSEAGDTMSLPDVIVTRIKDRDAYVNTGKRVTYAIHPEDVHEEAYDMARIHLFDGETDFTILNRDGGYEPDEGNKERDHIPPTPQEMKEQLEKSIIKKSAKKNRK